MQDFWSRPLHGFAINDRRVAGRDPGTGARDRRGEICGKDATAAVVRSPPALVSNRIQNVTTYKTDAAAAADAAAFVTKLEVSAHTQQPVRTAR